MPLYSLLLGFAIGIPAGLAADWIGSPATRTRFTVRSVRSAARTAVDRTRAFRVSISLPAPANDGAGARIAPDAALAGRAR